jgi:hypothetical protein
MGVHYNNNTPNNFHAYSFVTILNHKTPPLTEPAAQNIQSSVNKTTFTLKYFLESMVVLDTFYK